MIQEDEDKNSSSGSSGSQATRDLNVGREPQPTTPEGERACTKCGASLHVACALCLGSDVCCGCKLAAQPTTPGV